MNITKFGVYAVVAAALFAAPVAFAQSYTYSGGSCTNLSYDLSYGQKSSAVSDLQRFLVSQNYPGGGSWMITGYYGQATVQAVRNFQQTHGLAATGAVDSATRSAISSASCGFPGLGGGNYTYAYNYGQTLPYNYTNSYTYGTPYNYNYNYGYNYNYNNSGYTTCGTYPYTYLCNNNTYNYGYNYTYSAAPHLTSLSTTSAAPGTPVTVYGTGFDAVNNTVYVGGTTLSGISSNGTQVTFTMPADLSGSVSVSVGNSRGMSNTLTISTTYTYPYNPSQPYPCGYQYGSYYCPNTATPVVSSLSPTSGAVGTSVTVYGSGFSTSGNTVHFGNGIITNLQSFDGHSVSFTVPSTLSGYGYQPIGLGTYQVSVSNQNGVTSNSLPFTVTSTGSSGSVSITNVSGPTTLSSGVSGTWSITVQNAGSSYLSTTVNWGDSNTGASPSTQTYASGSTALTFSHTYYTAGTYTITFTVQNGAGQSNTTSTTVSVTGSGTTGTVTVSSISPTSGHVGTQLAIYGTGFDAYNNTVHFGIGGTMHVPAYNGVIYYTVPAYLTPCDVQTSNTVCAQYAQQVTAGSYPVSVTTPSGSSNTLTFQVIQ